MKINQQADAQQLLSLSSSMQESLKILQLNTADLLPYLTNLIESNPFLEVENFEDDYTKRQDDLNDDFIDEDFSKAVYDQLDDPYIAKPYHQNSDDVIKAEKQSLKSYIREQIQYLEMDISDQFVAFFLTDYLNKKGYLEADITSFSSLLNYSVAKIKKIIKILQSLDPVGVFARNLEECLELQLKYKKIYNQEYKKIIKNLDLIARYKLDIVAKKLDITLIKMQEYLNIIRTLNPKPGMIYADENIEIVIPDIFLKYEDGIYTLELNNKFLPPVVLNEEFYNKIKSNFLNSNDDQKKIITNYYQEGKSVLGAIKDRNETLYKVTALIIKKQKKFFENGVQYLNSLKLEDIATELNFNISTISRVVSNKYIACHLGVFKLKYFFVSKAPNSYDENDSSQKIKSIIKKIIMQESPEKILSDNDIVELLKEHAVVISRRTVAKYRSELAIGNVAYRKRQLQKI